MRPLFFLCFTLFFTGAASAEESDCAAFFQQDIHNKLVVYDKSTNRQISSASLCENTATSNSNGVSAQYAGYGVSFDQASQLARAMCNKSFSKDDLSSEHSLLNSVVDPNIVQAALECYKLNSRSLHYSMHEDLDSHSVTVAMSFDGSDHPTNITDIVLVGNVQCVGKLYSNWQQIAKQSDAKLPIGLNNQSITCTPQNSVPINGTADILPGHATIVTDAGNIYLPIPRRFSPSLENEFSSLKSQVLTLNQDVAGVHNTLANRVLGAAAVIKGRVDLVSQGATFDLATGTFTFPNPLGLRYVPVVTYISPNSTYATGDCFIKSMSPNTVSVGQGGLDTSGKVYPIDNCTLAVVGIGR